MIGHCRTSTGIVDASASRPARPVASTLALAMKGAVLDRCAARVPPARGKGRQRAAFVFNEVPVVLLRSTSQAQQQEYPVR